MHLEEFCYLAHFRTTNIKEVMGLQLSFLTTAGSVSNMQAEDEERMHAR